MNAFDFRASAVRVGEMRTLLQNPTLAEAIVVLKDEMPIDDATGDAIESVRTLSKIAQHNFVVNLFLSLAEPLEQPQQESEPTWGAAIEPPKAA